MPHSDILLKDIISSLHHCGGDVGKLYQLNKLLQVEVAHSCRRSQRVCTRTASAVRAQLNLWHRCCREQPLGRCYSLMPRKDAATSWNTTLKLTEQNAEPSEERASLKRVWPMLLQRSHDIVNTSEGPPKHELHLDLWNLCMLSLHVLHAPASLSLSRNV